MGGKSSSGQTSSQGQQSATAPWLPAQPALEGILSGVNGQLGNYQPNGLETGALNTLTQNAQSAPNFGGQASQLASGYLGGDPSGLLNPALQQYQRQLSPYANGQNLDPTQAPGMSNVLNTIRSDVSNSVNGQFAGAGRDLSGLNAQTLARGISQGEAAPLLNQYNQNVGNQFNAASNLFQGSGQTASAIGGNQAQGFNFAGAAPGLNNQNATGILAAQSAARGLPLNNLGMLENLTVPIAGLGGQSQGSGQSQSNGFNQASPMQEAMGWSSAFNQALMPWSKYGAFGGG